MILGLRQGQEWGLLNTSTHPCCNINVQVLTLIFLQGPCQILVILLHHGVFGLYSNNDRIILFNNGNTRTIYKMVVSNQSDFTALLRNPCAMKVSLPLDNLTYGTCLSWMHFAVPAFVDPLFYLLSCSSCTWKWNEWFHGYPHSGWSKVASISLEGTCYLLSSSFLSHVELENKFNHKIIIMAI